MPSIMTPLIHIELHRQGIGLLPEVSDPQPPATMMFVGPKGGRVRRSCTCKDSKEHVCEHLEALSLLSHEVIEVFGALGEFEKTFHQSSWYQLARILHQGRAQPFESVRVNRVQTEDGPAIELTTEDDRRLATYLDDGDSGLRFLERIGHLAEGHAPRARVLERLALFQRTSTERMLAEQGMKSSRQDLEESFWLRLAYHCVVEYGLGGHFHPAIDADSGDFTLTFDVEDDEATRPIVRVTVPRARVTRALRLLHKAFPDREELTIHPLPLRTLFHITSNTELDVIAVRPMLQAIRRGGEARYLARPELDRFRYGNLIYVKELGILAELEQTDSQRRFRAPQRLVLRRSQVPSFRIRQAESLDVGDMVLDEGLRELTVHTEVTRVEIIPERRERNDTWARVRYKIGGRFVELADLLRARDQGLPYLEIENGWVDLAAPALKVLDRVFGKPTGDTDDAHLGRIDAHERVRLSPRDLLGLHSAHGEMVSIAGAEEERVLVERVMRLEPTATYVAPAGLKSVLRDYQVHGVDWLRFLWENEMGGLLCDDMGLGKTHQAMALMVCLREQLAIDAPFLVVCPTSVIGHWSAKVRQFAPKLYPLVYHGPRRHLPLHARHRLIITSYGVLLRDLERLQRRSIALTVFDEAQQIKNRATRSFQSAHQLDSTLKIGMTGTPIENSVSDLKTLFDLVLPGYLGTDAAFEARFGGDAEEASNERLTSLQRIIAPFLLRRRKEAVLDELPAKIEDTYTCHLSNDQETLYQQALVDRGQRLRSRLERDDGLPVPYIHIFALLTHLKRICDHPALALGALDKADDLSSGKWELFCELLSQSLASGQKVVIFTQYLGMINLMARHLDRLGVGYETLTGASTNRGLRVDRFNQDPECRVFLGSLKAGGTGIDLIGGSVVIHYDRWWNAAREDQATDRVYRMGQRRAVQVIKLVTEGTIEERIADIIDAKRQLSERVIQEDDPSLAKIFSRDELLALLAPITDHDDERGSLPLMDHRLEAADPR